MLKKGLILGILIAFSLIFVNLFENYKGRTELPRLGAYYANNATQSVTVNGVSHEQVGAANLVTSVVVTYRGLDTLGEVVILFLTAAIIGFFLKLSKAEIDGESRLAQLRKSSEILETAATALVPLIFMFGIYIFINGHLTPGGGFQGGAVIATGFVLMLLASPTLHVNHAMISFVESFSGLTFVILGVLGAAIGLGFLDNTILPLGTFGKILSAGAIPVIYSFIGLKVGAELSGIVGTFNEAQAEK